MNQNTRTQKGAKFNLPVGGKIYSFYLELNLKQLNDINLIRIKKVLSVNP